MDVDLTPRICMVDDVMESAAPLYRALDMGLDELHPAAHHQSRPPSVTLFNIIRPADDRVGGRGGVDLDLTPRNKTKKMEKESVFGRGIIHISFFANYCTDCIVLYSRGI